MGLYTKAKLNSTVLNEDVFCLETLLSCQDNLTLLFFFWFVYLMYIIYLVPLLQ